MACTVRQSPCAWRAACRRCPGGGVAGPMWAAALGGCEWLESWKLGRTLDDAVLDLVRRLADAPLPDPPPVLRALLGHTLDEVLLRGLTALYSLLGCEEQQRQPDGDSDGAAVSATWLDAQYRQLAEDERRLGADNPSVQERQATLDQLSRLLRHNQSLQQRSAATSTAATSSRQPSRSTSVAGTSDVASTTDTRASGTVSSSASTVQEASPRRATTIHEESPRRASAVNDGSPRRASPAHEDSPRRTSGVHEDSQRRTSGVHEDSPRRASTTQEESPTHASTTHDSPRRLSASQDRQLIERPQSGTSTMPEWILPGVAESQESIRGSGTEEEGGGRTSKKVHFKGVEDAARTQRESGPARATPPCECCMSAQPARPSAAARSPCVCPCGKATRVCVVRHPECVCDEPSSEYLTGHGTSAMPSRTDAVTPNGKRLPSESAAATAETPAEEVGTGDQTSSKPTDKRASSVRPPAPSAPPAEEAAEAGSPDTDWHSAASTPRGKPSAPPAAAASAALWPRGAPCPCCPPRRRRPRAPANCPEQILWAVTKICVFPDASRTYEVLTPTFEKPPRASGRTHVVFAMRPP